MSEAVLSMPIASPLLLLAGSSLRAPSPEGSTCIDPGNVVLQRKPQF
jgi:hypothetical protein